MARVEALLGTRPVHGGRHPGWGTRNALLSLGPGTYLEVIGPDPERGDPRPPELFGIGRLEGPRLVTWAAKADGLEERARAAAEAGLELGAVATGRRRTADGRLLSWTLTDPRAPRAGGVVPFLIDWGGSAHPAGSAPPAGRLLGLSAQHPEPGEARRALAALGLELPVRRGPTPRLAARIASPRGVVVLR